MIEKKDVKMKPGKIKEQQGIALLSSLLILLALAVLGFAAVNISTVGTKITSNVQTSKQAFYLAEAGIEVAREQLRTQLVGGTSLTSMLTTAANGVALNNSTTNPRFTNSSNTPFVSTTNLGTGSFKVYLTNDSTDGLTSTTDTNGTVTLTSIGSGPDNAVAIVQVTTTKGGGINLPNLPGAITIAGPGCVFDAPNSNVFTVDGRASNPAVAVNSATSYNTITGNRAVQNRAEHYIGTGGSPSVTNSVFGSPWDSISALDELYTTLKNSADYYVGPSDPDPPSLGSAGAGKIVVVDRDFTLRPPPQGIIPSGILLVTGELTLNGNFRYDGIILVVGKGNVQRNGGGTGTINGGIYVANILGPDETINTADDVFGFGTGNISTFDTDGGGNSTITYDAAQQNNGAGLTNAIPFTKTSWRQY
jgi:Tfp pilus assembly protein PilX